MEPEKSKVETTGNSKVERQLPPPPPPPRDKKRKLKIIVGSAILFVLLVAIICYVNYAGCYESTDDAFIDGYVTIVSPRVPGQIDRLLVTDNQLVKKGD